MNVGGVEAALISLLNRLDYDKCLVDLYLLKAEGEFLERIPKQVNIIDLSIVLNPVQWTLVKTQNIHTTIDFAKKNKLKARAVFHSIIYAACKIFHYELPAYQAACISKTHLFPKYDAVFDFHGYASFTSFFGAYILRSKRKYTWCHSQLISFEHVMRCISHYDKMFVVSASLKEAPLIKCIKIPVEVFYNFIDTDNILSRAKNGPHLTSLKDEISLLTVGRLSEPKGYDLAILAAGVLKESGMKFKWYFCGLGEEKDKLVALVERYSLGDCIVFMGYQDNPYGYMASCDLYVQPSKWEGYAVTIMEAKILKKVVVTTDVSGAREAVTDGEDGFITTQDYREIALKIATLLTDKQLLNRMNENAAKKEISQHSSELMLDSIINAYE